ncbi:hypothetical protein J437_LFUL018072 [Ladona fulva]|uniref:RING-type E3 ubiquitin transferase (cysteine targeting) n=1 Tax=Ladona fulva TaxID=123851 RepID=A0A8K0KRP7_LADFU|nr:hypothetical protein J437_LFUL018072 [Ladona fulva]
MYYVTKNVVNTCYTSSKIIFLGQVCYYKVMEECNSSFVPRVTQLDALELDGEIVHILKNKFMNSVKYSGVRFLNSWEPELELFLKCLLWKFSAAKSNATFGQQLLGIKFRDESSCKKVWLLAAIVFGTKYIHSRSIEVSNLAQKREAKDIVHRITRYIEIGILISKLINFLKFLHEGKYPSLGHRVARLTVVPIDPGKRRTVGYSFMTREILWHGFIEFLSFTLPLINYHYIKRRVCRLFLNETPVIQQRVKFTLSTQCPVCDQFPVLPQTIGCTHIYCYYCIAATLTADPNFECTACGHYPRGSFKPVEM